MSILKCDQCGADIPYNESDSAIMCPTCGAKLTIPLPSDTKQFLTQKRQAINTVKGLLFDGVEFAFAINLDESTRKATAHYLGDYPWKNLDIVEVISSGSHALGLKADGTVVAVGDNSNGQCNVSGWRDIVAIATDCDHTVGLKSDGTVVAVGQNEDGECNLSSWKNITAIAVGNLMTVGLKADGTVVAVGLNAYGECDVSAWTDIVAIAAGSGCTIGLKADGTVVATGENDYGQCNVSSWKDIVAITVGESFSHYVAGLKADGTVVVAGEICSRNFGSNDTSDWHNIVALSGESFLLVGLRSDGTVVATGEDRNDQCNVSNWTDVVAIQAGYEKTFGLKADGTILCTDEKFGQNNKEANPIVPEPRTISPSPAPSSSSGSSSSGSSPSSGGCYVATCVYGSYDCPPVWTLRRYRDNVLSGTILGRLFIQFYYAVSPTLVKRFGKAKWFRLMCRVPLDRLVSSLNAKGIVGEAYCDPHEKYL